MIITKKAPKKKVKLFPTTFDDELPGTTKYEKLNVLYKKWFRCERCSLHQFRLLPDGQPDDNIVFASGSPDAHVMIIGEGPGEEEVRLREPFVGHSGFLLNEMLAACSDDHMVQELWKQYVASPKTENNKKDFHKEIIKWRDNNFFVTNLVSCRPPENRTPTAKELEVCWNRLWNIIYIIDPLLIIGFGRTTLQFFTETKMEISKKHGELFDVSFQGRAGAVNYPFFFTFHPAYLLRKADWEIMDGDYSRTRKDIRKALRAADFLKQQHYGIPMPFRPEV